MIRHLKHSEIDKAEWDRLLLRCPDRLWYAQSWVLELCCPQWEALIGTEGSIMPLVWRRKYGFDYLYQPYGVQQQGVYSPHRDDTTDDAFLEAIPHRFRYCDIHVNARMRIKGDHGFVRSTNTNQTLQLDADATSLRAGYAQGHRRNLRKIGGDVPVITRNLQVNEFIDLFERTTARRHDRLPSGAMVLLDQLLSRGRENGQTSFRAIRSAGRAIAAICFMEWEGRSILLKSANDDEGRDRQAMFHLVDAYIAENAGSGAVLDFAGSNTPSVARFNAGFGARSEVYLHLVRNRLPPPLRWFKR